MRTNIHQNRVFRQDPSEENYIICLSSPTNSDSKEPIDITTKPCVKKVE